MRILAALLLLSAGLAAEMRYPRHNINLGIGAGQPRGDLRGYFLDRVGLNVGYGYRFHPYFQADFGLDTIFGSAGVKDYLSTSLGELRIRDYQFLLPMGGRAIAPLAGGRLLLSAGVGGAYMRYGERVRQPSQYYRVDCPVCASRSGWGYYGLLGASAFLDRYQHFRLGVTSRVYRGHTEGDPLGPVPGLRTRDHWINIFGEFGVSF